ncbi:hypothetical protein [Ulvibacter antarcticus]|uniref:hypothetical protein n=1 Tax=Ulvibacter antarcticus TaxID=442714 RepID=UPI001473FF31|nr:hypothetical protein [Ulvibacter antarcticus]
MKDFLKPGLKWLEAGSWIVGLLDYWIIGLLDYWKLAIGDHNVMLSLLKYRDSRL